MKLLKKDIAVYVHPKAGIGDLICDVLVEDETHYIVSPAWPAEDGDDEDDVVYMSFYKVRKKDCKPYDDDKDNPYPWA